MTFDAITILQLASEPETVRLAIGEVGDHLQAGERPSWISAPIPRELLDDFAFQLSATTGLAIAGPNCVVRLPDPSS
jgi:hypothetical protein